MVILILKYSYILQDDPEEEHYNIDYNGWHIDGTIMEWDYSILDRSGYSIARVSKELFHMTENI